MQVSFYFRGFGGYSTVLYCNVVQFRTSSCAVVPVDAAANAKVRGGSDRGQSPAGVSASWAGAVVDAGAGMGADHGVGPIAGGGRRAAGGGRRRAAGSEVHLQPPLW